MTDLKLTANDFGNLCDAVFQASNSLASCTRGEVERESLNLRCAVNVLCAAKLARHNDRLIERRRNAIKRSSEVLARRAEGEKRMAEIAAEVGFYQPDAPRLA